MNTLNRELTAQVMGDAQTYDALRTKWSAIINSERKHELTASHHLIYLALLGKDWRKAFTPVTNRRKLYNGGYYNWGLHNALHDLLFAKPDELLAPFDGLISASAIPILRQVVPTFHHIFDLEPKAFAGEGWPFDAYAANILLAAPTEAANA